MPERYSLKSTWILIAKTFFTRFWALCNLGVASHEMMHFSQWIYQLFTYKFLNCLQNCFLKNLNIYPGVWRAYANFHGITVSPALEIDTLVLFLTQSTLWMEYCLICFYMLIWWCDWVTTRPLVWCCMYWRDRNVLIGLAISHW